MNFPLFRRAGLGIMICSMVLGVLLYAPAGASPAQAEGQDSPLFKLLPEADSLAGWTMKDGPQAYEGDDLFLYIDGGAEIYHEFGFTRVIAQDYWKGETSITIEIFEMATPEAAFGIYSHKRGSDGKSLELGAASSLEGYYVNFWRGRYLVTLTASEESEEAVKGLQAAAGIVDSRIKDKGDMPALTGVLPAEGLAVPSVKYMKGPLGFLNNCSLFPTSVFLFKEGVKGDYQAGFSAFVFRYDTPEAAAEAMARADKAVRGDAAKYRAPFGSGPSVGFEDAEGKSVRIVLKGRFINMIIGKDKTAAEAGLKALEGAGQSGPTA